MESQTIYSTRSDSGGFALLGFGLAAGFACIAVFDHPSLVGIVLCGVIATFGGLFGVVALVEVVVPARLELNQTGFAFRRPIWPGFQGRWDNIMPPSVVYTKYGNRASYRLLDSGHEGRFRVLGTNSEQIVELMNNYRQRALANHPPPLADAGFGHRQVSSSVELVS